MKVKSDKKMEVIISEIQKQLIDAACKAELSGNDTIAVAMAIMADTTIEASMPGCEAECLLGSVEAYKKFVHDLLSNRIRTPPTNAVN